MSLGLSGQRRIFLASMDFGNFRGRRRVNEDKVIRDHKELVRQIKTTGLKFGTGTGEFPEMRK
jgi:hypothetical protein